MVKLSGSDVDNIEKCYRTGEWSLSELAGFYEVYPETIRQGLLKRKVPMNKKTVQLHK